MIISASAKMVDKSRQMRRGERRVIDVKIDVIGASAGVFNIDFFGGAFCVFKA